MPRFAEPAPLEIGHELAGFDSGQPSLDVWLADHARNAAKVGSARTYVVDDSVQQRVVGFHALTVASIEHEDVPARVTRGMPRHPIPVILLARLAVDRSVQGRGIGAYLLADAIRRTVGASEQFGIRALLVHALNDDAASFYRRHGLQPSPTDPSHMLALVKDLRAALRTA